MGAREKHTFLRHRVELRLSAVPELRAYQDALNIDFAFEVKKLDESSSWWTSTCWRARSTTPCATCPR